MLFIPEYVEALHDEAKRGDADMYAKRRVEGRQVGDYNIAFFQIDEGLRNLYPALALADQVWLVYD